ncbi:MAG: amino acid ABC transporter substrate-binding protein [Kiritimatiellae bacterium]|nr:amino acid ABC transporter substrate-binding protein [Kiritimatiellia bacterium]
MRFFVLLALVAAAGCGRDPLRGTDPRIADASRPLVMLTFASIPPFSYRDETGAIVGSDVDLARKIAGRMGRELVVEGVSFTEILPRLKAGTADMGIAAIAITDARRRDVDFSEPYDESGGCFLYRKDGRKPRMSQISTCRIAVESDTVDDLYLCRHGCDPVRFKHVNEAIAALERGDVDAVFFDSRQLETKAQSSGGTLLTTAIETRYLYAVAVDKRRGDVLEAANAVIAEGDAK